VVVEIDEALRGVLHDILALDGSYDVTELPDHTAAVTYLASAPEGVIAICSNRDAHHQRCAAFFAVAATDERLVTRHRYLMLSTNPARTSDGLRAALAHLGALVLEQPV
jgi:hypothetical protein